jgi:hypothetical protein
MLPGDQSPRFSQFLVHEKTHQLASELFSSDNRNNFFFSLIISKTTSAAGRNRSPARARPRLERGSGSGRKVGSHEPPHHSEAVTPGRGGKYSRRVGRENRDAAPPHNARREWCRSPPPAGWLAPALRPLRRYRNGTHLGGVSGSPKTMPNLRLVLTGDSPLSLHHSMKVSASHHPLSGTLNRHIQARLKNSALREKPPIRRSRGFSVGANNPCLIMYPCFSYQRTVESGRPLRRSRRMKREPFSGLE